MKSVGLKKQWIKYQNRLTNQSQTMSRVIDMILYTPLCHTDVFPADETEQNKRQCVQHDGKLLYVEQLDDGSYELLQLLSSDPQDFLKADYVQGKILSWIN